MSSFLTIWSRIPFSSGFISQYGWVVKASGGCKWLSGKGLGLCVSVVQSTFYAKPHSQRKASGGLYLWQLLPSPIVPVATGLSLFHFSN